MKNILFLVLLSCLALASNAQSERAKRLIEQRPGAVIKPNTASGKGTQAKKPVAGISEKQRSLPSSSAAGSVRKSKNSTGPDSQVLQQSQMAEAKK